MLSVSAVNSCELSGELSDYSCMSVRTDFNISLVNVDFELDSRLEICALELSDLVNLTLINEWLQNVI